MDQNVFIGTSIQIAQSDQTKRSLPSQEETLERAPAKTAFKQTLEISGTSYF